jgi:hypothetical protein
MSSDTKATAPKRKPLGDHQVGYCKPPVANQFRAGDPRTRRGGRPRKLSPEAQARAELKASLEEMVSIGEGEGRRRVSAFKATILKLRRRWLVDGDLKAFREWMALADQFGVFDDNEDFVEAELAPDHKTILDGWLERRRSEAQQPSEPDGKQSVATTPGAESRSAKHAVSTPPAPAPAQPKPAAPEPNPSSLPFPTISFFDLHRSAKREHPVTQPASAPMTINSPPEKPE